MIDLFEQRIIDTGRLPLFGFFVAFIVTFVFTRVNVRLIRANVRWWFRNVQAGDVHIHHVVFGVVLMLVGGVAGLAIPDGRVWFHLAAAVVFGMGSALVLDEFALILHLSDVYWTEKGRASVDAVFVAIAVTGLLVLGVNPLGVENLPLPYIPGIRDDVVSGVYFASLVINLVLATITLLKGKIWTGLIGLFVPALLVVGALRVARPGSPWSRWRYDEDSGRYQRAVRRETQIRRPLIRGKIWVQEFIAGRHDLIPPERRKPRTAADRARGRRLARARARTTARLEARRARTGTPRAKNPRLRLGRVRTARAQNGADHAGADHSKTDGAAPRPRRRKAEGGRAGRPKAGRGKIGRVRAERANNAEARPADAGADTGLGG